MCPNLEIDLGNDLGYLGLMNYANAKERRGNTTPD